MTKNKQNPEKTESTSSIINSDKPSVSVADTDTDTDTVSETVNVTLSDRISATENSFSEMKLPNQVLINLQKMKIQTPTEIQFRAIPVALKGESFLAVAQTGTGKTLAFLLPLVALLLENKDKRALILTPSQETAMQTHKVLSQITEELKIDSCAVTSGTPLPKQASLLKKNPQIIVATPGRLTEHLQGNKLLLKGLSCMVIDEADRLLEVGFKNQFQFITSTLRGSWQTMMFAATASFKVEELAKLVLKEGFQVIKTENVNKPIETLKQKVYFMSLSQKNNRLLDIVKKIKKPTMIFADSKESCVKLGRLLEHNEFRSDFVNGDMNPGHRNRIFREFREKKIQILITTDLMARGLDFPEVEYVINYELPYKSEDFLHRIGRTARAGKEGMAITFITSSDYHSFQKIKSYLKGAEEETIAAGFKFEESK